MPADHLPAILAWARRQEAIRAVVITGSRAHEDGSVDAYSDLDAQILTTDSARYVTDDSWLDSLGEVWIRFPLDEPLPFRLVWFAGGAKVDFQFIHPREIQAQVDSGRLSDEFLRGYRVLLDKDGLFAGLPPSPRVFPQPPAPSPREVRACCNEFWFEAIHVAQFIRRREFWVVKFRDWTMKTRLLQLLEWQARASSDAPVNTWLLGKRMRHWTRPADYAAITDLWAGWDAAQLWQALLTQLRLFDRLSREVCAALGYPPPEANYTDMLAYIEALAAEDPALSPTD